MRNTASDVLRFVLSTKGGIMRLSTSVLIVTLTCVVAGWNSAGRAQESGAAAPAPTKPNWLSTRGKLIEFPASPDRWLNSAPLSLDGLKGKGIVLYFFEEECPNCRDKWPALLAMAKSMQAEPVIFIAVNSGNSPDQVKSYLKQNNIDWPVIVDTDRSFEQTTLADQISLGNIIQIGVLTASGDWHQAAIQQLNLAAKSAAEKGHWKVDPAIVPAELQQAWRKIEIGNYADASRAVMQAGSAGDETSKAAAKQLFAAVKQSMDAELAEAGKLMKSNQNWPAYKALEILQAKYDGYPMHPAVAKKYDELGQTDEVKQQYRASKKLAAAIRTGSLGTPSAVKRATADLKEIVEDFAGTEGAGEAQAILDKLAD